MVFIDGSIQIPLTIGVFNAIKYAIEELVILLVLQKAVRKIAGIWIRNRLRKRSYGLGGTPVLDELALQPNLGREGLGRFFILTLLIIVLHGTALFLELGTGSIEERHFSGIGLVPAMTSVTDPGKRGERVSTGKMYNRGQKSARGCVERFEDWSVYRVAEINGTRCSEERSIIRLSDFAAGPQEECTSVESERERVLTGMIIEIEEASAVVGSDIKLYLMFGNITFVKAKVKAYYTTGCNRSINLDEDEETDMGVHKLVCVTSRVGITFRDRSICITERVRDGGQGVYVKVYPTGLGTDVDFIVGKKYETNRYGAAILNVTGQLVVHADVGLLAAQVMNFQSTVENLSNLRPLIDVISIGSVGDFGEVVTTREARLTEMVTRPTISIDAVIVYVTVVTVAALAAVGVHCFAKGNSTRLNQPLVYAAVLSAHIEDGSEIVDGTCDKVSRVREIGLYSVQEGMSHLGPAPKEWNAHVSGNLILGRRGKFGVVGGKALQNDD